MDLQLCRCGCGREVRIGREYLQGHNKRGMPSCMLGKHHTEETKGRLSDAHRGRPSPMLGRHITDEVKAKLSQISKAQWAKTKENSIPIGFTGKHHTEEIKAKLLKCHLGKHLSEEHKAKLSIKKRGEVNPFYGRHHTEETRAKIGIHFLGKHLSEEQKNKISKSNKGKVRTEEQKKRLAEVNTGKHLTEETKKKLSQATKLQRMESMGKPNSIDRTGTHHSPETIAKMSKPRSYKFNIGRRHSDETKAKIGAAFRGKHLSTERIAKMTKWLREAWKNPIYRKKHTMIGANHPNWQGGISFEPYTKEFNKQLKIFVRMRDDYTCQLCGVPEVESFRELSCHHIDYVKTNSFPSNLISLCTACNTKVNSNREFWSDYFRDLLNRRQLNPKALVVKGKLIVDVQQEVGLLLGIRL